MIPIGFAEKNLHFLLQAGQAAVGQASSGFQPCPDSKSNVSRHVDLGAAGTGERDFAKLRAGDGAGLVDGARSL